MESANTKDGLSSRPKKKYKKMQGFWKKLTTENLSLLHSYFKNENIKRASSRGIGGSRIHNQESLDATGSLISSTGLAHGDILSEDGPVEGLPGGGGGLEASNIKGGVVKTIQAKRPKNSMDQGEWVDALTHICGGSKTSEDAAKVFSYIDRFNGNLGYVTWGMVLDYYIGNMMPDSKSSKTTKSNKPPPLKPELKFRPSQHSKRQTIVKIVGVASGTTFVYIVVSKFGLVGIYDEKYRLQRQYEVDIDTDPNADLDVAASDPGWVTDALWMDNSKHAVYVTSLRTMHFYDASASVHYEEYRAFGFQDIPTCIDYSFKSDQPDGESMLMFGDAAGGLTIVTFFKPLDSLFAKDEVDSVQCLFWPDVVAEASSSDSTENQNGDGHAEFVSIDYEPSVHNDGILGVKYLPSNKTVITISRDPNSSLLIRQVSNKFDSYVFKLSWGVRCFDYTDFAGVKLIVTASNDKIVRTWNPVVTSNPTALLVGHKAGINDLKINAERKFVFSYDKHAVLKVWDLNSGVCLQTLPLDFPSFTILGKTIEFGRPALYTENATPELIIATCCEHIIKIELLDEEESSSDEDDEAELLSKLDKKDRSSGTRGSSSKSRSRSGRKSGSPSSREEAAAPQIPEDCKSTTLNPPDQRFRAGGTLSDDQSGKSSAHSSRPSSRSSGTKSRKNEDISQKSSAHSDGKSKSESPTSDVYNEDTLPRGTEGRSAWQTTQKVVRARTMGRMLMSQESKVDRYVSQFRLFGDHLEGTFQSDDEDIDWGKSNSSSLNVLRVQKYLNNSRMKELASDNMPFMALEIHGLAEAKLRTNLPHTKNMIERGIRIHTLDELINMPRLDAPMDKDKAEQGKATKEGAAPTKDSSPALDKAAPSPGMSKKGEIKKGEAQKMVPIKKTPARGSIEGAVPMQGGRPSLYAITEQKSGPPSVISEGDSSRTVD